MNNTSWGTKSAFVSAFDRNNAGKLVPAFEPKVMEGEFAAEIAACIMAKRHAGVIAWVNNGKVVELVRYGEIPEKWS